MEEKTRIINSYYELLNSTKKLMKLDKDEEIQQFCKKTYIQYINDLYKLEKKEKIIYENMLEEVNIDKKSLILLEEEKKNTNIDKLEVERYIYNEIVLGNDKKIQEQLELLQEQLITTLENPNDISVEVWIKNYINFVQSNKSLNQEMMIAYIYRLFELNDKKKLYIDKLDSLINKNIKKEDLNKEKKGFSIKKIKRTFSSKNKLLAMSTLGLINMGKSNNFYNKMLCYLGSKVRKLGFVNRKIDSFIKENDYTINENQDLVDNNGNMVSKEEIGKIKYFFIKDKLIKIKEGKEKGTIKKEHKTNKLTSILLGTNIVKKLRNKFNNSTIEEEIEEDEELVKDMKKGMIV